MKDHYDIGIVGCWYWGNYGSLLNGYATFSILKSMGLSPLNIVTPYNGFEPHAKKFFETVYKDSDISDVRPFERVREYNSVCEQFLTGSDQIWNYKPDKTDRRFDKYFKLDFVDDDKKRISFATSFGKYIQEPENIIAENINLLKKYSAISVRENESVDILEKQYGIKAVQVMEPVLCVDSGIWYDLAQHSKYDEKEQYLLTYILDPTPEKRKAIQFYAQKLGLKAINILDGFSGRYEHVKKLLDLPNTLPNIWCADLLKYYSEAQFVITDSFHGACFSLIFNKPFIAIGNHVRGIQRFESLLSKVGLLDRLISDPNNIPLDEAFLKPISFTNANKILEDERVRSVDWLKKAVETPKDKLPTIVLPSTPPKISTNTELIETDKLHHNPEFIKIRILATLLRDYRVRHIVLSPGGRDVPLVRMFEYNEKSFVIHRVTDERSAAYFGLGIATQLREPVACICTSGTAASNYLPAVTEAYYTGIPLIVITADRLGVYHEHGEDQTIPQQNIYNGVIKKSITVPEGSGYNVEYQTRRDISDCILEATHNGFGPTHINIAIDNINIGFKAPREAWALLPRISPHILRVGFNDGEKKLMEWVNALKESKRILIVYGQNSPLNDEQKMWINKFAEKYNCVIVTDHISNLDSPYALQPFSMLRDISQAEFNEKLSPDILITVGGKRLMSDTLTFKVRSGSKWIRHWSVTPNGKVKDFYFRLSSVIEMSQDRFFEWFASHAGEIKNDKVYFDKWNQMVSNTSEPSFTSFNSSYIHSKFFPNIPAKSMLHLGVGITFVNSRQFFIDKSVEIYCNMGTNGIDGCTSTFMGQCSVVKDKLCFLIVGDLSFFYDMNGIWNKQPTKNIRILMINNNGSGLLRGHRLKAITSVHNTSAKGWVESTGFKYMSASSKEEYEDKLRYFLSNESDEALFFEVFCE